MRRAGRRDADTMPAKRTRNTRSAVIPRHVIAVLGLGARINTMAPDELRDMWREWGPRVTEYYRLRLDREPFVGRIAAAEGWNAD